MNINRATLSVPH